MCVKLSEATNATNINLLIKTKNIVLKINSLV